MLLYLIELTICIRCTAHNNNLDGSGGRWSHKITEALLGVLDPQTLSNEYGIIHDIVVCMYSSHFSFQPSSPESTSLLIWTSPMQTSMNLLCQTCFINWLRACSKTMLSPASGNWWEFAQALYNITIISMCIHMHHSDTHLDHVSYSMGVLRASVIAISLLICCHCNQVACFYHARSLGNFLIYMIKNSTPTKCNQMYL